MPAFGGITSTENIDLARNFTISSGDFIAGPLGSFGTSGASNGAMRLHLIYIPATTTFDRIACEVTSAGSAGSVTRLGIYNNDNGAPGSLVLDAGTVATTSTGVQTITINQQLTRKWYWLAAVSQGSPSTDPTHRTATDTNVFIKKCSAASLLARGSYLASGITGALPASAGASLSTGVMILTSLRAA